MLSMLCSIAKTERKSDILESYLLFLQNFKVMRELSGFVHLDPLEERLLDIFGAVWHEGGKITVLHAMSLCDEISCTTAHRRMKSLRKKGLIELLTDENDNRVKHVVPTQQTIQRFSQLGECLLKARSVD